MSISAVVDNKANTLEILIDGQFDFSCLEAFRRVYQGHRELDATYIVNLQSVEYMDSSALGMILLLKKHAETNSGQVVLTSPNERVLKILNIASFEQLVSIVP
ncbi:STAS domain-containing protein [bacterium]|nr:STAS domain-containing protein [bacterium]